MPDYILALDQGTTSSRALVFDRAGRVVALSQREFRQIYPRPGWVEHDPDEIWATQLACARDALAAAGAKAAQVAAIGIANQRETTVLWERSSGRPLANAIVWQDRRTADFCRTLDSAFLRRRTGLPADPYFSASKLRWIRENVPLPETAVAGTVDAWVLWSLTGGRRHATDASNASRTLLFDLRSGSWDPELCAIFGIPPSMLPAINMTACSP